jgi:hypothetical protein
LTLILFNFHTDDYSLRAGSVELVDLVKGSLCQLGQTSQLFDLTKQRGRASTTHFHRKTLKKVWNISVNYAFAPPPLNYFPAFALVITPPPPNNKPKTKAKEIYSNLRTKFSIQQLVL